MQIQPRYSFFLFIITHTTSVQFSLFIFLRKECGHILRSGLWSGEVGRWPFWLDKQTRDPWFVSLDPKYHLKQETHTNAKKFVCMKYSVQETWPYIIIWTYPILGSFLVIAYINNTAIPKAYKIPANTAMQIGASQDDFDPMLSHFLDFTFSGM